MTDRLAECKQWVNVSCTLTECGEDKVQWLIAEVERLTPDAERWRYVREQNGYAENLCELIFLFDKEADAAVDAARKTT